MSINRIVIVGAGAMGCLFAAKLARGGADVTVVDVDAARIAMLARDGITLADDQGTSCVPVHAALAQDVTGPADLVMLFTKSMHSRTAAASVAHLAGPSTAALTLQNGLGNEEFLAEHFGAERVMGGLCFVCLNRVGHGTVEHYGHGSLSVGEFSRTPQPRTDQVAGEFRECGIKARTVEALAAERRRKLVWNVPFNGLSIAAGGITTDQILADEGLLTLLRNLMREIIGIAAKEGHIIPESFIDVQVDRTTGMGAYKPSSLIDFAAGRAVEVESIWGEPYLRGLQACAEVGRLEALYFLLKKLNTQRMGERS